MLKNLQTYYVLHGYRDGLEHAPGVDDGHYVHIEGREPLGPFITAHVAEDAKADYAGPWSYALPLDLRDQPFILREDSDQDATNTVEIARVADAHDELEVTLEGSYEKFTMRVSSCGDATTPGHEVAARMAQLAMSAWDA